jgi:hypothetical protein
VCSIDRVKRGEKRGRGKQSEERGRGTNENIRSSFDGISMRACNILSERMIGRSSG